HTSSHDPVEVVLDPLVVDRDDIVQRTRCRLGHGGSFSLAWLGFATSSSARFGAASPIYFCVRFCTSTTDPSAATCACGRPTGGANAGGSPDVRHEAA